VEWGILVHISIKKSYLKLLMSLLMVLHCTSAFADGLGPVLGAPVEPMVPGESVPLGLEDVPPALTTAINNIAGLPAYVAAAGGGSQMVIPEITTLQNGLKMYMANRQACIADQPRAAMFCREETSPGLQSTLQKVNLGLAAVNSLAVNDACKAISKALMVAQLGVTAYTVTCGMLQKKCNMSCSATAMGMKEILKGLVTPGATCTPGMNPVICPEAMGLLESYKQSALAQVKREAVPTDPKTIYFKEHRCAGTYTMLLASAGLSIISMVKTMQGTKQCDKDSDGGASGGSSGSATTATQNLPGSAGSSEVVSSTPVTSTPVTSTPVTSTPVTTTPTPEQNLGSTIGVAAPAGTQQTRNRESASVGGASASPDRDPSGLRAYLPDGTKAVPVTAASAEEIEARKQISPMHGPSNFEKMRVRMREIGLPLE
jgi:hypothetical protein